MKDENLQGKSVKYERVNSMWGQVSTGIEKWTGLKEILDWEDEG